MRPRRHLAVCALWLAACAGVEPAPERDDHPPRFAPPTSSAAQGEGEVWFAARATPCVEVVRALAVFAAEPGVVAPAEVRTAESGAWCSVTGDEQRGARADSWAQNVSSLLKAPAVAFYVADGAWSYAVFDRGEPLCAMESHYGEPVVVGDAVRGAAALGLPSDVVLRQSRYEARNPAAHLHLAAKIGLVVPAPDAPSLALASFAPKPPAEPEPPAQAGEPAQKRFQVGQWAAMPPLGLILVKAIDTSDPAAPVYLAVAGSRTLRVPVSNAEKMGMRPLADVEEADAVLAMLTEDVEVPDAESYVEPRTRGWLNALKAGDLRGIGEAFRAVCEIRRERKLFSIEAGLLDSARQWLATELAVAKSARRDEIDARLGEACN